MNDITKHDDTNVADSMPPADPALLASANRMLSERRLKDAKDLICSASETLAPHVGGEIDSSDMDLYEIADAVALNVVRLMTDLTNAKNLNEVLKRNFASKEHECEALRRQAEAANERAAEAPIVGYYVIEKAMTDADTLDDATQLAMRYVREGGESHQVIEARLIGTAKRAAEWVPA